MVLQSTTSAVLTNSVIRLPVGFFCRWKDLVVVFLQCMLFRECILLQAGPQVRQSIVD